MDFILYMIAGLLGGILGGMGMGGGTILIPILTLAFDVEQHLSQSVNLLAFIPMALVSLSIHSKNGLVQKQGVIWIIIPALILSVGGSFLAEKLPSDALKIFFGWFLIILSVFQFKTGFKQFNESKEKFSNKIKK